MRCEYTVTYEDFRQSMIGYRRISKQTAFGYWLYVWALPAIGLVAGVTCLALYFLRHHDDLGPLIWCGALGLGIAWGFPARYQLGLRRAFRQRNALVKSRPMLLDFDQNGIRFIVPEGTEISYPWTSFTHYFENGRVLVLFVQDAAFHTISTAGLGSDSLTELRSYISSRAQKV